MTTRSRVYHAMPGTVITIASTLDLHPDTVRRVLRDLHRDGRASRGGVKGHGFVWVRA